MTYIDYLLAGILLLAAYFAYKVYFVGESYILADRIEGESYVNKGRFVTLHYTNWCPACKQSRPHYEMVKRLLSPKGIRFTELDEDIAKTPGILYYPTLRLIDEHGRNHTYKGTMQSDAIINWIVSPNMAE